MAAKRPQRGAAEWDWRFTRMCGVSALAHVAVGALVLILTARASERPLPLEAYTVEITDPRALGGRMPAGPRARDLSGAGSPAPPVAPAPTPAPKPPPTAPPGPPATVPPAPAPTAPPAPPPPVPPAPPPTTVEPEPAKAPEVPPAAVAKKEPEPPVEQPKPAPEPEKKPEPPANEPEPLAEKKPEKPPEVKKPEPPKVEPKKAEPSPKPPAPSAKKPEPAPEKAPPTKAPPAAEKVPAPAKPPAEGAGAKPGSPPAAPAPEQASPPRDAYAAAAERWRTKTQKEAGGGLGGSDTGSGPIGAGGTGPGGGGRLVGVEFLAYRQQVINAIKGRWTRTTLSPGLVAVVRFQIHPDGRVSDVRLERTSGNAAYDLSAMRAVQQASPLSPPPARYANDFSEFLIEFHSEERLGREAG